MDQIKPGKGDLEVSSIIEKVFVLKSLISRISLCKKDEEYYIYKLEKEFLHVRKHLIFSERLLSDLVRIIKMKKKNEHGR